MIARVLSIATKISSEIFKCNRQVAGATNLGHDQACRVHRGKATGAQAPDWVRINSTCATKLLQGGGEGGTKIRGRFYGADASGGHRGVFVFGGALAAADDRAGVAHAAAWRRGLAGDEANDGLLYAGLDPLRGALFGVAADFADQNNGVRVRVVVEKLDGVEEGRADNGVAADADAGGLADAQFGELMHGFVCERAAAADYADISLLMDAAGHDADFAFAGRNDARAVGADEARLLEDHDGSDTHHVESRNAFRDADGEGELCV